MLLLKYWTVYIKKNIGPIFAFQLCVEGSLDLEVGYYNEKLAVWEPLIEPVINEGKTRRWQLNLEVSLRSVGPSHCMLLATEPRGEFEVCRSLTLHVAGN